MRLRNETKIKKSQNTFIVTYTGLLLVFSKIFPGFPNFFQVFKSTHFQVCFKFKVKCKVRNYLLQYKNIEKIL